MKALDKNSPVPIYYQLYNLLLNQIKEGELKPGDKLPTEISMMNEYGISRATVRQAVLDLVHNGYVVREKSKGTFVKEFNGNVGYKDRVKGFSAISSVGGTIPLTSKVLEQDVVIPVKSVREALHLKEGESAFYLRRTRFIDGEANTYTESWIPYKICKGIEEVNFTNHYLYQTLEEKYGVVPQYAIRTFDCVCANNEEQIQEMGIKKMTPLLQCVSQVYDKDDDPVEYCIASFKGKYTVREEN